MESLKAWAKTVYLVAVVSASALLMIPKRMQKQSKFVMELLLLLVILAPVANFANKSFGVSEIVWTNDDWELDFASLGQFYSREAERQAKEISHAAGFPVQKVSVKAKAKGLDFSGSEITLYLNISLDDMDAAELEQFKKLLAEHLSTSPENIYFEEIEISSH